MSSSSYAPPNETSLQLFAEATWLQGAIVTSIMYGVTLTLFGMCSRSLWLRIRSRQPSYKKDIFFLAYVIFVFVCATIYEIFNAEITQFGFINDRNFPGGPAVYEETTSSMPINVTFLFMDWCADLLMIWRCMVVYRDTRFRLAINVFGAFIFIASLVTGLLWLITVSMPSQSSSGWMSLSLLFPYLSVSLASTLSISSLTVLRFLYHRARIAKVLGRSHGTLYVSFAAMIVESASIYAICSLFYIIPYATGSPLANAFMQILGMAQGIAPLLIIHRVAEGKAWTPSATMHTATTTSGSLHMQRVSGTTTSATALATASQRSGGPLNIQVTFDVEQTRDETKSAGGGGGGSDKGEGEDCSCAV